MKTIDLTTEMAKRHDSEITPLGITMIAQRWAGAECYLNDKPARITGRLNRFATVAQIYGSESAVFAWPTVNRIMYGRMMFVTGNL